MDWSRLVEIAKWFIITLAAGLGGACCGCLGPGEHAPHVKHSLEVQDAPLHAPAK